MKTLRLLLLSLCLCLSPCIAFAAELTFVPNGDSNAGTVRGEAPLTMLGTIPLRNGTVILNDKVAALKTSTDYSDTPRTVLAGSVLRTEASLQDGSSSSSVTGLVIFLLGEWMNQIDNPAVPDIIFRKEGQIRGRIIGRDHDNLVLQTADGAQRNIPLASMLYIKSPRVFVFSISTASKAPVDKDSSFSGNVVAATFRPTASPRAISLSSVVPHPVEEGAETSGGKPLSPAQLFEQDDMPDPREYAPPKYMPNWLPQ